MITFNQLNGEFLGYPPCCITAFGDVAIPLALRPIVVQKATAGGFVPCMKCAKKLLSKQITYDELINTPARKCSVPFKVEHDAAESIQITQELRCMNQLYLISTGYEQI